MRYCSLQLEKSPCSNGDPVQQKIKKKINKIIKKKKSWLSTSHLPVFGEILASQTAQEVGSTQVPDCLFL